MKNHLRLRYGSDYDIVCETSPEAALAALEAFRKRGADVAVVLAAQWTAELTGEELLSRTHRIHPHAKRGLLVDFGAWGDDATAEVILRAMTHGCIDYYVLKPWRSPDELFHRTVAEFVHEWSRTQAVRPKEIAVVGDAWAARTNELTGLLSRNGVPHAFHAAESPEGRALLRRTGMQRTEMPVVALLDGTVLVNPSNAELAGAYGVATRLEGVRDFDVVVVGAGPAGLSAAVYASSEGLSTLVIERDSIGGQAGSSSLIRNYLGFSRGISGAELAQRAYQQAWVFGTKFVLMDTVVGLEPGDERHTVLLAGGDEATGRAVVLANGVAYEHLAVPSLEALVGAGVFYGGSISEPHALAGDCVYVVGGGNSAGQAAIDLARYADRVTIVIRGSSLAATMSQYLRSAIDAAPNISVRTGTEVVDGGGNGRLQWLELESKEPRAIERVPTSALFVLIGATPHTDWLPDSIARDSGGFVLTGGDVAADDARSARPAQRHRFMFETSVPGVFAVGDTRHGSVKRVAAAVGEGSVAVQEIHEDLRLSNLGAARTPLASGRARESV